MVRGATVAVSGQPGTGERVVGAGEVGAQPGAGVAEFPGVVAAYDADERSAECRQYSRPV